MAFRPPSAVVLRQGERKQYTKGRAPTPFRPVGEKAETEREYEGEKLSAADGSRRA
jgi:hypothetical protein